MKRNSDLPTTVLLLAFVLVATLTGCGGGGGGISGGTSSSQVSSGDTGTTSVTAPSASAGVPTPSPAGPATPVATPVPGPTPAPAPSAATNPGDPVAGISSAELAQFTAGRNVFVQRVGAPTLGPIFNNNSCVACHGGPAPGGSSRVRVTRFGSDAGGTFDPLTALGGSLLQTNSVPNVARETVPPTADVTAQRRTTPLFGDGLIEAIPDSAIVAYAQTQAAQHPGQAGQVCFVTSPSDGAQHVGRFGWKCQQALLLDFSGDAFANEMGVSNPLFPFENQPNAAPLAVALAQVEDQPDASGVRNIDRAADFTRLLAPLPRTAPSAAGAALFQSVGCAVCHNPSYTTVSAIAALDGQTVSAYSDFLLHDVGTGDGIVQGNAPASKMRTAPLLGVAAQPFYLHDGSAGTVDAAITRHGGEATAARTAYQQLTAQDRATLLQFLQSL